MDIALWLTLILLGAKLGGHVATRLRQPSVLGELIFGLILGNLPHLGITHFAPMAQSPDLDLLAKLGVLLLLFQVGLESTVRQMLQIGRVALRVAFIGVLVPFILGYLVAMWLLPSAPVAVLAFVAATLTATSVGITARVLRDLNQAQSVEARVILAAAVIDDVLGLLVLAVVSGAIAASGGGHSLHISDLLLLLAKAAGFLIGALALGVWLAPRVLRWASHLHGQGALQAIGLSLCFLASYAADAMGLAAIVGAFAAGLILEDVHYSDFVARGERGLDELVKPIADFLVPVFFVVMGLRTDLATLAEPGALVLALGLTVAAVVGKQVCGLVAGKGLNRLTIGIGMIPRGEVGLIFANVGLSLQIGGKPVLQPSTYAAIVLMVMLTTLLTPPLLRWSTGRSCR